MRKAELSGRMDRYPDSELAEAFIRHLGDLFDEIKLICSSRAISRATRGTRSKRPAASLHGHKQRGDHLYFHSRFRFTELCLPSVQGKITLRTHLGPPCGAEANGTVSHSGSGNRCSGPSD